MPIRSFDVDLHCNTFKIRFRAAGLRRCMQARSHPEHAAAKRGHHRFLFFFWSEKKGGFVRTLRTPLGYVPELPADSLLRHVEITGDFDFLKITTTETTFLPVKSTPESQHARTSNERNKVAPQVKCSWKRNKPKVMSTQRFPTSCFVAVEIA